MLGHRPSLALLPANPVGAEVSARRVSARRIRPSTTLRGVEAPGKLAVVVSETASVSQVFEAQRGRLFSLAYRLLGSACDAEDVLQTAFERWIAAEAKVAEPQAWLTTVVANLCLKELGSPRRRREVSGPWLPEPVVTSGGELGPLETAEQRDSVSFGLLILLEKLSPAERAVFVLRQAFGYGYPELAHVLGRSEPSCRQLHRRAVQRLGMPGPSGRFQPDAGQWRELTERFLAAAARGDVLSLERLLADDVTYVGEGDGSGLPMARKPVAGRSRVAQLFGRGFRHYAADPRFAEAQLSLAEVNGELAVLAWSRGRLVMVLILESDGSTITALWLVTAPRKLDHVARSLAVTNRCGAGSIRHASS
jgi:RNA polymerase sigma factor (sigma-70 family)